MSALVWAPTLAIGAVAGWLAHRHRLPGGAILAALAAVAVLHLAVPALTPLGDGFRTAAQILIGVVVGSGLRREPFRVLRTALSRIGVVVGLTLAAGAAAGIVLHLGTDLPLVSALLSTVPGGAGDVTAAALQLEQDAAIVAGFHIIRQLLIFIVLAAIFQRLFQAPPPPPDKAPPA